MKKFISGIAAVTILIVTSFAFTKPTKNVKFTGPYYFHVNNTVGTTAYNSATLDFPSFSSGAPSTTVPSSFSCDAVATHLCAVGFPGYKLDAGVYKPSTAPNGGTLIAQADYSTNQNGSAVRSN